MRLRVAKNSAVTLTSPTFVDTDGDTPADATGTPTCTVSREDGTALAALTVTDAGIGVYTAPLTTTHTSQLDRLTVTWTGTVSGQQQVYTDEVEVVGGHYVTIPEIRGERGLDDISKYPVSLLREVRDEFADMVEGICGVAFVRRYHRDLFNGAGRSTHTLTWPRPRSVISVKYDGVAQTAADFSLLPHGVVVAESGVFPAATGDELNVAVAYEHGFDAPPADLRREALKWIRGRVFERGSGIPENAISTTFEGQTIRLSTPDPERGRPTGIMSLDQILTRPGVMHRVPGIA